MKKTKIAVVVCAALFASCSESAEDGTETNAVTRAKQRDVPVEGKVYVSKNDPQNQNCPTSLPAQISQCRSEIEGGRAFSCYDDNKKKTVFVNVSHFPQCFSEFTETSTGDLTNQEIIAAVPRHVSHPVQASMSPALTNAVLKDKESESCKKHGVRQETKDSKLTIFVPVCVKISYTDTQNPYRQDVSSCSIDERCRQQVRDLVPVDIQAE